MCSRYMKRRELIIGLVIIVISVLSTIFIILNPNKGDIYGCLFMLPASFAILSFIFIDVYKYIGKYISISLILGVYFFRSVIIPIVMSIGNYHTLVKKNSINILSMNYAIIIMMIELVVVFLTIYFVRKKFQALNFKSSTFVIKGNMSSYLLVFFLIIVIPIIVFYPQVLGYISFSLNLSFQKQYQHYINILNMQQQVPKLIYNLFIYVFTYTKYLLPFWSIKLVYEKIPYTKNKFICSCFIIIFNLLFLSENKASSFFETCALIWIIGDLYPAYKKKFFTCIVVAMPILIFAGIIFKSLGSGGRSLSIFEDLSLIFQAYFGGPANVAVGCDLGNVLEYSPSIIIWDILRNFFPISFLFKSKTTSTGIFNNALYGNVGIEDQIMPMIAQLHFYVGPFLCTILIAGIIVLAIKCETKIIMKNYMLKCLYLYISILLSVSLVTYNITILVYEISVLLPLLLVSSFCAKYINYNGKTIKTMTT